MWDGSLAVARAAKIIGRLTGASPVDNEHLFVAGLFASTGAAALAHEDAGYLGWRTARRSLGTDERWLMRLESVVEGMDHAEAGGPAE